MLSIFKCSLPDTTQINRFAEPFLVKSFTSRRLTTMRGVVFQFCLIVYALEVEIDARGSVFDRTRTFVAGAGDIAAELEALRTYAGDAEVGAFPK